MIKVKIKDLIFSEKLVSGNSYSFIKLSYGVILFILVFRYLIYGWWEKYYVQPIFHFRYPYFEWIPLIPNNFIFWVFILLMIFSLFIILGIFYKISLFLFLLLFTWIFFQDVTYYINHYYFIIILGIYFLLLPEPIHNIFASNNLYPQWAIQLIRIQIATVYFYAGIAKIQPDWLIDGLPLKIWLARNTFIPINLLSIEYQSILFSWIGMLFDITIPFWLSFKKTRKYAYILVIVFHILTRVLFEIGVFPWVMILFTTIFFESNWPLKLYENIKLEINFFNNNPTQKIKTKKIFKLIAFMFLVFQLLFPLRFILYLKDFSIRSYMNEVLWKERGFRWSWRVMLVQKSGYVMFYIYDIKTKKTLQHNPRTVLTSMQYDMISA
jgi:hypothetical protein